MPACHLPDCLPLVCRLPDFCLLACLSACRRQEDYRQLALGRHLTGMQAAGRHQADVRQHQQIGGKQGAGRQKSGCRRQTGSWQAGGSVQCAVCKVHCLPPADRKFAGRRQTGGRQSGRWLAGGRQACYITIDHRRIIKPCCNHIIYLQCTIYGWTPFLTI